MSGIINMSLQCVGHLMKKKQQKLGRKLEMCTKF